MRTIPQPHVEKALTTETRNARKNEQSLKNSVNSVLPW